MPSTSVMVLPELDETRSPGMRMPNQIQRVGGGDALQLRQTTGCRAEARRDSTATGRANCSPRNPLTKRPPRISPWSSRRRRAISNSRQRGVIVSRATISRKTTPYLFSSVQQMDSMTRDAIERFAGVAAATSVRRCGADARCGLCRGPRGVWDQSAREYCRSHRR